MNEWDHAVMEGNRNATSDRYFLARPDFDTQMNRKLFEDGFVRAYRLLYEERKELNPWLPIENAPKDRPLLLLTKEYGYVVGKWFQASDRGWWVANCMPVTPTHYQELPETPI